MFSMYKVARWAEVIFRGTVLNLFVFVFNPGWMSHYDWFNAFMLARAAGDVTQITMYLAIVMLHNTLCYRSDRMHRFWKQKFLKSSSVGLGLMPGGFAPRPAAFSLGA